MLKPENKIELLLKENEELISIFVASIKTAKENRLKEERRRNERMSNHES